MDAHEGRRWVRTLRENLRALPAIRDTDGELFLRSLLDDAARRLNARIVFRPEGDRWCIHREHEPPTCHVFEGIGLRAAWAAIDAGRCGSVPVRSFTAAGTRYADRVVRRAIRSTAADWIERATGHTDLAAVLRGIVVTSDDIQHRPHASAPQILTR